MRKSTHALALATALASGSCGSAWAATENREVANFDEVVFAVAGEVRVEQGPRETLVVEAEPAVLRKITSEVQGRRLVIGVAPGRIETKEPIRFRLGVKTLRAFESRTTGSIDIGPLSAESLALVLGGSGSIHIDRLLEARKLDVRINGAGHIDIDGGRVAAQRIAIGGTGSFVAPTLASEHAEVAIEGSGQARLSASHTLAVRIAGIGQVRYRGNPAVTRSIAGIGSVDKED